MSGSRSRKKRPAEVPLIPIKEIDEAKRSVFSGVGYKNPPHATRFKKGQSGNPKGRPNSRDGTPRIDRSASELILKEAERLVTVREGEQVKQITAIEAVIRAQVVSASRGNSHAQRNFIAGYEQGKRERQAEIEKTVQLWRRYVAHCRKELAHAELEGQPPPKLLPHPDDVIIDRDSGVRVIGPMNDEEAEELEKTTRLRDLHIMQHVLEERQCDDLDGPDRSGTALVFARVWNNGIPPRLRLSELELQIRMWPYQGMSKRKLLKLLRREWREIGAPRPRGWMYPPLRWAERFVSVCREMGSEILSGEGDGSDYLEPMSAVLFDGFGRKPT